MFSYDFIYFLISGIITGFIGFLLGIGGGFLLIPILTTFLDVSLRHAISASMFSVIVNSLIVSSIKLKRQQICIPLAISLEGILLIFGFLGAVITLSIDTFILSKIFAVVLTFAAIKMCFLTEQQDNGSSPLPNNNDESLANQRFYRQWLNKMKFKYEGFFRGYYYDEEHGARMSYRTRSWPKMALSVALSGVVSGMFGIGGGIFNVPVMTAAGRLPMRVATATSSFMIGIGASGGALLYFFSEQFSRAQSIVIMFGVPLGAYLADRYCRSWKAQWLKWLFAIVMVFAGIKMWIS